ncbi:LptA/OstA family protein [Synechococcus elongatus]|uniref:LptA/OstA family protein n=2 Tax=Synechococcus elongatus TaxID=32046 RepID=A0AAN1QL95_SYNEL|nr:LptA/OstA family protein [Synechococcus elongatus]AZB71456.1 OstA family protein [Synechococcus elongatus PCC 11801]QFZ91146.1 OstA family protein [Synechococcus elongatus PCC 11802]
MTAAIRRLFWGVSLLAAIAPASWSFAQTPSSPAPAQQDQSLTLLSDIQEANSKTGVVTARGNVVILYPARQLRATAAQAQYFSRERRIILTGNVYVQQEGGNSLRGETVTYLIETGKFVALPTPQGQVQSIYNLDSAESP